MTIAIIDLGTNTFNLLLVKQTEQRFKTIYETKISVKLGEGGINKNIIMPAPFQRGIDALIKYKGIINEYMCSKVFAFATSAIRSASNGTDFVKEVKAQTGLDITIINGEREAELIYFGVKSALEIGSEPNLIMDIGGGSTEFIIASNETIFWKKSYNIGAARLLEQFNPSEPITLSEISSIENYFDRVLDDLIKECKRYKVKCLIGSSGSFDSLADVIAHKYHTIDILNEQTSYNYNLHEYFEVHKQIVASNREQREQTKGLIAMRVDMIVIASIKIHYIIKRVGIEKMRLSTCSLKEGVLFAIKEGHLQL